MVDSGVLVRILFAPLFCIEHQLFDERVIVLVFFEAEMTVDKGAAHKISKTLERHLLLIGGNLSEKFVDLVFKAALLG